MAINRTEEPYPNLHHFWDLTIRLSFGRRCLIPKVMAFSASGEEEVRVESSLSLGDCVSLLYLSSQVPWPLQAAGSSSSRSSSLPSRLFPH